MKKIQLLRKLERYPLFTNNDVVKLTNKDAAYVRKLLYRLAGEGLIQRIEKGKYTVYEDPLIFASYLETPSYVSLWSALRLYNMTQQQPVALFVMAPFPRKAIRFHGAEIIFKATKHMFGYKKERYADFDIFLADKEKAIIDALLFKLPLEDVAQALETEMDAEKLTAYALRTKNHSLIKRLGYLLEIKNKKNDGLKALDNNYILLDSLGKKSGKKDSRWKLIINEALG